MTTLIIYHQVKEGVDCPDGIAAAWVASKAIADADILGCVYGDVPDVSDYERIVIVDFSFPVSIIEDWVSNGKSITVIDHHKTAWENFQNLSSQVFRSFDMNECGATLTFKHFFPNNAMPVFLHYIRDRDLWNHELEYTEEIHEASASIGRTFKFFDKIAPMAEQELFEYLVPIGTEKLKPKREAISNAILRVQFGIVAGWGNIPYVETTKEEDRLVSDICSCLYKRFHTAPFVACFTSDGKWSLRSDKNGNNTDVGAIAKSLGGGGHRNAAGFEVEVVTSPSTP